MMFCKNCGKTITSDEASFCDYCGEPQRDDAYVSRNSNTTSYGNVSNGNAMQQEETKPITFGNWFGSMMLMYIPIVGPIVYIVMLFLWSFQGKALPIKKNWARAQLTVMAITILIGIVFNGLIIEYIINSGIWEDFLYEYQNSSGYYY